MTLINTNTPIDPGSLAHGSLAHSVILPPSPDASTIQLNTHGGVKREWINPERLVRIAGQDGWFSSLIDVGPDKRPLADEHGKPVLSVVAIDGALLCLDIDQPLKLDTGQTILVSVAPFGCDAGAPESASKIFAFGGAPVTITPAEAARSLLLLESVSSTFWLVKNAKGLNAGPIVIARLGPDVPQSQG